MEKKVREVTEEEDVNVNESSYSEEHKKMRGGGRGERGDFEGEG